jgi:D-arabinose 1-dehydrogenase-like Zn-dependent alcohol dehydrogenase
MCGWVEKVGPKVPNYKRGDRVGVNPQRNYCGACDQCKAGLTNTCDKFEMLYGPHFGSYSTSI